MIKRILEKRKISSEEEDGRKYCSVCLFLRDKESNTMFLQNEKNNEVKRLDLTLGN